MGWRAFLAFAGAICLGLSLIIATVGKGNSGSLIIRLLGLGVLLLGIATFGPILAGFFNLFH